MANVTEAGNVQVITQVLSQNDPRAVQLRQSTGSYSEQRQIPEIIKMFKKCQPTALGALQIFLGTVHISFGIIFTIAAETRTILSTSSGADFWIGFLLLISGSLSVAAEKRESMILVKACLGSNLLTLVAGLVAAIIFAVTMNVTVQECKTETTYQCDSSPIAMQLGLNGLILTFLLLEIATAASIAAFAWKALREAKYTQML